MLGLLESVELVLDRQSEQIVIDIHLEAVVLQGLLGGNRVVLAELGESVGIDDNEGDDVLLERVTISPVLGHI